ncbi:fasciclin domain-containing protein, partial [Vibrio parahaemolyticus]
HLEKVLQTRGPFTVFAAEDKAFDKMGLSSWVAIWDDQRRLRQIMSYNIVKGEFDQNALTAKHELPTMEGHDLRLDVRNNKIFIGKARV